MLKQSLLVGALFVVCLSFCASFRIGDLDFGASEYKKGGGKAHQEAHYEQHGAKGDKGFKVFEEQSRGAKGSHNKENHKTAYGEVDGGKKAHHHNHGYAAAAHAGQHGSRGHHFADQGRFAKGHNTHGHHHIHKLDEYKKRKDFYDEDHDELNEERHGGYEHKKQIGKGAYHKKAHENKGFLESLFGKLGAFSKGNHYFQDAGHKKAAGHDSHYNKGEEFAKEDASGEEKKFGFSHSH